jgi:hypothetical protein
LVKLVNRLGAKAVAKVGELVTLPGGGTPPRIYVWSQVTPNIAATPRKVAAELRCMGEEEQALLSEILAKLPDAERILSGEPSNATKAAKPKATKAAKPKVTKAAKPKATKAAKPKATKAAKPKATKAAKPKATKAK